MLSIPAKGPGRDRSVAATHLLLYLDRSTYAGAPGARLAATLRAARAASLPIVMVHENDTSRGHVCEFGTFFQTVRGRPAPQSEPRALTAHA